MKCSGERRLPCWLDGRDDCGDDCGDANGDRGGTPPDSPCCSGCKCEGCEGREGHAGCADGESDITCRPGGKARVLLSDTLLAPENPFTLVTPIALVLVVGVLE